MSTVTILHLSDLHLGMTTRKDMTVVLDALLRDLKGVDPIAPFTCDLVVFSGDLVDKGDDDNFSAARTGFLQPLSSTLALPLERFFIVPGNHDVQRSQVDSFDEAGFSTLTTREALNDLLDTIDTRPALHRRLTNYYRFRDSTFPSAKVSCGGLLTTAVLGVSDASVGVACLNSSWRATGAPADGDRGRLLVGERQVDAALDELGNADIRIAVLHHPPDCLAAYDMVSAGTRLFDEFDLVLTGHNHFPDPVLTRRPGRAVLHNAAGCLYQSREYFNGYSIITVQTEQDSATVTLREYLDRRRCFDRALRVCPEGQVTFDAPGRNAARLRTPASRDLTLLCETLQSMANGQLLTQGLETQAPKALQGLFVEPPLCPLPEEQLAGLREPGSHALPDEPPRYRKLAELLEADRNLLFIGRKESGKTTLLMYAGLLMLSPPPGVKCRLPMYVDFADFRSVGEKAILKTLRRTLAEAGGTGDIVDYLRQGQCILLLDNLSPEDARHLDVLTRIGERFPGNLVLCAVSEDLLATVEPESAASTVPGFDRIYIHGLRRREVRRLVQRWFHHLPGRAGQLASNVMRHTQAIRVPLTPFIVSLVLWVLERQREFSAVNHASLVEQAVEAILEKPTERAGDRGLFDYRNKEHYLAYLASVMVRSGRYWIPRLDLESVTVEYFRIMGFRKPMGRFLEYFLDKGILIDLGDIVSFKFPCFLEFFLAKRMLEDEELYGWVLAEERYLAYAAELDFLTGLQRTNRSLVELLATRTEQSFREAKISVTASDFESIDLAESVLDAADGKAIVDVLKRRRLAETEREELLDELSDSTRLAPRKVERTVPVDPESRWLNALLLMSRVVRNCELIEDADFKTEAMRDCLNGWAVAAQFLVATALEQVHADKGLQERVKGKLDLAALEYVGRIVVPIGIQSIVREALGSEKLEGALERLVHSESEPLLVQILCVFLHADLGIEGSVDRLRTLVRRCRRHRYSLEIVFYRLYAMYVLGQIAESARSDVEALIGEIAIAMNGTGNKLIDERRRNSLVSQLRKRWLLRDLSVGKKD